jgi:hypothetical protein
MKWRDSAAHLLCAQVGWASSSLWAMAMKLMGLSKHLLPFSVTCSRTSRKLKISALGRAGAVVRFSCAVCSGWHQTSGLPPDCTDRTSRSTALHLGVAVLLGAAVLDASLGLGDAGRAAARQ